MKKHLEPGATIITDEHPSYVNLKKAMSHLTRWGMYHYWVNHASYRYAHEHFPFVYTNTIERTWLVMKK